MNGTLVSGDQQGDHPLFLVRDKQGDSPLVRNMIVAEATASVLIPALSA